MSNKLIPQVSIPSTLDAEWSWKFLPTQTIQYFQMFSTILFGFLVESVEFSGLAQVANDRFCSIFSSEFVHSIWNLIHSSLFFKHCILWSSLNSEFNLENHALPPKMVSKYLLGVGLPGSAPQAVSCCLFVYLAAAVAVAASISTHS